MFDSMLMLMESPIVRYFGAGEKGAPNGAAHPGIMPFEAFATQDGHLNIACGNDRIYRLLCTALERPDLAHDPRFLTNDMRVQQRPLLHATIEAHLVQQPTAHWLQHFLEQGVPAAPINNVEQALAHPQVAARQMLVEADDPVLGAVKVVGSPFKLSAFADDGRRRAGPDLDADRATILRDFGIEDRRSTGAER